MSDSFFNKLADLRFATLLKKRLWHRCFPVNFAKLLRTPFLQNISGQLLLNNGTSKKTKINPKGMKPVIHLVTVHVNN